MKTRIAALLACSILVMTVAAAPDDDTPPGPLQCGSASFPVAVAMGATATYGSYATAAAAMAAADDQAVVYALSRLLALQTIGYLQCEDCPPNSTTPRCPRTYVTSDFQQGDTLITAEQQPDGTWTLRMTVAGAYGYSLSCGLCTPKVD